MLSSLSKSLFLSVLILLLLPAGVQAQAKKSTLRRLIRENDTQSMKVLISEGLDLNRTLRGKETLLLYACRKQKTAMVRVLLESGADPNIPNRHKEVPLLISVSEVFWSPEITQLLLEHGANINYVGKHGASALRSAILLVDTLEGTYLFDQLLERGAELNNPCEDCCSRTMLHYACSQGTGYMVNRLLEEGASPDAQDCKGRTPLEYARIVGRPEIIAILSGFRQSP